MPRTLDIAPLRSFVAVADCGGFQHAARSLHLSQAAISQHVRRLEAAVGRPLVARQGRGSRFTADGEQLLVRARRILTLHDESLLAFGVETEQTIVIGSTEHAAAQLLPHLAATLEQSLPEYRARFRIDRGTQLRDGLAAGRIDMALLLGSTDDPRAVPVGELELTWYAAPDWRAPITGPIPLVAFDDPCALRTRALETLAEHAIAAEISAEAPQLAGVQAAVGARQGVALMATLGQPPAGLAEHDDLPKPLPLPLAVWSRPGLAADVVLATTDAIRQLLGGATTPPLARPPATEINHEITQVVGIEPTVELARGA
ncbi:DNA-binding transcriptional LysR family regulator [Jatrophihabitans sp. GAS493]|uniref:LysR family transcriptional regulator n=1 Tax=Jatrophihabitans sp. GAS493 TaxID=1907575 RepID=UPI000BB96909|nr:LysR family transcriptional regulator [Jatrophihabitans sp. GAS493]SOD72567.1 DNA-binding transcriptional LysR family regulator [Jatrophihabitans sp. GAS493]